MEFRQPPYYLYFFGVLSSPSARTSFVNAPQDKLRNKTEEIERLQSEVQRLGPTTEPTPMAQMAHTSMEFAMASLGFCVLGMIIALVAIAALKRCTSESEDYDVEVSTGLLFITSHQLREYEVKELRSPACCRQENAISSPHIHATDGK